MTSIDSNKKIYVFKQYDIYILSVQIAVEI